MILVSGAGGFIGRALLHRLRASGRQVLGLTRGAEFLTGESTIALDLDNAAHFARLREAVAGCTALVHLAGRVAIELAVAEDGRAEPRAAAAMFADVYQSNIVMTARLMELALAAGIPHVVFASSQTVYGLPASERVVEESPLAPLEHYAASKVACETVLALWARAHRRDVTVLRFPGVWSEHRKSGLVHSLCGRALREGRVRVGAEYPLPLDVLHCDDVVEAFVAALARPGNGWRAYNVATGEPCSLTRLGRDVADLVPGCVFETFGVPQPDLALDSTRAAMELGWSARPRGERLERYVERMRGESLDA